MEQLFAAGAQLLAIGCRFACCLLPHSFRALCPHPEAAWPLAPGDLVRAHVGPRPENWALGRVAAVRADGTVAVCFTDAACCSCAPGFGVVETTSPQDCWSSRVVGRVAGTVEGFTQDQLHTAGHCPILGPAAAAQPVSQPKW
jgi:hypothetical protein